MPEKDAEKHLTPAPSSQLANKAIAAMMKRSLAELVSLRDQIELPPIDWNQPAIIGKLVTAWLGEDAPEQGAGAKWVTLCCNLSNVSDTSQDLRGELIAFVRSQARGLAALTNVQLRAFPQDDPTHWLRPGEEAQIDLDFVWVFSGTPPQGVLPARRGARRWDGFEDFVRGMWGDELLLYDKTFGTVVRIPNAEDKYRELRLRLEHGRANERFIVCEECGTEYPPGTIKLSPISDELRFDLWPDDTDMFFCTECDTHFVVPPTEEL